MKHIVLGRRPVWLRSILILFLLSGVILSTNAQDPHLSIDLNKVTIKQFFDEIQRKTDYTFSYREGVLDNDRDVVVSAKNKSLSEILTSVLKLFYSGEIDCGYTADFGCPTKYGEGSGSK